MGADKTCLSVDLSALDVLFGSNPDTSGADPSCPLITADDLFKSFLAEEDRSKTVMYNPKECFTNTNLGKLQVNVKRATETKFEVDFIFKSSDFMNTAGGGSLKGVEGTWCSTRLTVLIPTTTHQRVAGPNGLGVAMATLSVMGVKAAAHLTGTKNAIGKWALTVELTPTLTRLLTVMVVVVVSARAARYKMPQWAPRRSLQPSCCDEPQLRCPDVFFHLFDHRLVDGKVGAVTFLGDIPTSLIKVDI